MPSSTKLIFLPGAGGNPQFWQPVADLLTHPAQRKLLGWPGFGAVPADPKVRGMADLVSMVVDQIDQPTALVAQSMGGVIAIQAALRRPELVTHLVLAVTSGGVELSALQAEDWRPAFFATNPTLPGWLADYREDMSDAIPSVRAPTLLLWGDADPISPVTVGRRLNELLPASRLHVFAGAAHDLAQQRAAQVAALIDQHLESASS